MINNSYFPIELYDSILVRVEFFVNKLCIEQLVEPKTRQYKKGQSIYMEDNWPAGIYQITKGLVKKTKVNNEGREFVMDICSRNDWLGTEALLLKTAFLDSAVAMNDVEVRIIKRDDFMTWMSDPDFEDIMYQLIAYQYRYMMFWNTMLAQSTVKIRLAWIFHLLYNKFNQKPISISRDDLSAWVGTAKENLVRLLQEFKKAEVISINGREITITKANRLFEIAGVTL